MDSLVVASSRLSRPFVVLVALLVGSAPSLAQAYTFALGERGRPIRWPTNSPYLAFAGNPSNSRGVTAQTFFDAIVRGLQRWQRASGGQVRFDYWQGSDARNYPTSAAYDGQSTVSFASASGSNAVAQSGVIGVTQLWFDAEQGTLLETDIVLNDVGFAFTTQPSDTTGFGNGRWPASGSGRPVFIENVLTHEIGHALGLGHSGTLQASMLFVEAPEQAYLGCDDQIGIQRLFPGGDGFARSQLVGRVVGPSGAAVFGAQVQAISLERATVLATAVTDVAGGYAIEGLPAGSYAIGVEPFSGGAQALPAYYAQASAQVCAGGQSFRRTWARGRDGAPLVLAAGSGARVEVPAITVSCAGSGAAVEAWSGTANSATAPVVTNPERWVVSPSVEGRSQAWSDRVAGSEVFYRLGTLSGSVRVHALAFSLYSPLQTTLTLLDAVGNPLPAQLTPRQARPVYTGASGYANWDSWLEVEALPEGEYLLRVTTQTQSINRYPGGQSAMDSQPFVIYQLRQADVGRLSVSDPWAPVLPAGARCAMAEEPATYRSPAGAPPRSAVSAENVRGSGPLGCGQVRSPRGSSRSDASAAAHPANPATLLGVLLPWLLMLMGYALARRAASR